MKPNTLLALASIVLLCLVSSCSRKESPTQSSDKVVDTRGESNRGGTISQHDRTNKPADKSLIKELIFMDLGIDTDPLPVGYEFGFYVIEVDADEILHFSNYYKGHVPRVEVCDTNSSKALIDDEMKDRNTKRSCMLLSPIIKVLNETHAEVSVGIRSGRLGGAFYDYTLTKKNNNWRIAAKKLDGAI